MVDEKPPSHGLTGKRLEGTASEGALLDIAWRLGRIEEALGRTDSQKRLHQVLSGVRVEAPPSGAFAELHRAAGEIEFGALAQQVTNAIHVVPGVPHEQLQAIGQSVLNWLVRGEE